MSTTTDVVLAAGPTVVALAAIGSSVWQQRRALRHERELADLAAVRSVLDDAALALERIGEIPEAIGLLFSEEGSEAFLDKVRAWAAHDLAPAKARLTVRFGQSHALVMTFDYAMDALNEWESQALYFSLGVDEGGPKGDARSTVERAVNDSAQQFREHVDQFLDRAAVTAGARLP